MSRKLKLTYIYSQLAVNVQPKRLKFEFAQITMKLRSNGCKIHSENTQDLIYIQMNLKIIDLRLLDRKITAK